MTAMVSMAAVLCGSLPVYAGKPPDPAAMKAKVQARGIGQGVRVTLSDNTEVKGLIVSIEDASFAVKAKRADQPQTIQFAQVTGVHNDKMGTGTKIIIVVAVVGAVIGIVAAVFVHKFNIGLKGPIL
ncbi:MAG: hypothetical protein ABSF53_18755 [Terracidiphilus sp.]